MPPDMQRAHANVKAVLNKKNDGYTFRIGHDFPTLREYGGTLMCGSFGWTDTRNKIKWIRPQHAYTMKGVQGYVTPSQVARAYLTTKFGDRRHRMRAAQAQYAVDNRKSAPLYAAPGYIDDAVYVDIKSAYWTIIQAVGLAPEYMPHRFLARRSPADDFPYPAEKLVRNILVSAGLPGWATVWDGHELKRFRAGNPHINLMLWSVCMDVLHGVARDMVAVGARYVHTDGYILPKAELSSALAVADAWGLPVGVKYAGECEIWGVATYSFTGLVDTRHRRTRPRATDKINAVHGDWLRQRVKYFSKYVE